MSSTVKSRFEVKEWDEQPFDEQPDTAKLTRASVTKEFSGDVRGRSSLEYLMAYASDGSATFVGLERIDGEVAGRRGTLVLRHVGRFEDGAAKATVTVVGGGGTGELASASGGGDFLADPNGSMTLRLDG